MEIRASLAGEHGVYVSTAQPYPPLRVNNPIASLDLEQVLAQHPYLQWDEPNARLVAAPGIWKVAGSLILPRGLGLKISAGTTLQFEAGAHLIARGPLDFAGTEQAQEPDPPRRGLLVSLPRRRQRPDGCARCGGRSRRGLRSALELRRRVSHGPPHAATCSVWRRFSTRPHATQGVRPNRRTPSCGRRAPA